MEGLAARALPRLRDGSLDWAAVVDVGDLPLSEFHSRVLGRIEQHIVVRQGHPQAQAPTIAGLTALEWVQSGPSDGRRGQRVQHMFIQQGHSPPQRVLHCDALAALSLLRTTDVAGIVPAPLLAQPEGRDLVALRIPELHLPPFTLVLLSQPDVPLTAPAAHLADCLVRSLEGL
jgi:DNA-binding transcriptional LysR family regulator